MATTRQGNIDKKPDQTPVGQVSRDEYFEPCYEHLATGSVVVLASRFPTLEEATFHIEHMKEVVSYYNPQRRYFIRHVIVTIDENRIDL